MSLQSSVVRPVRQVVARRMGRRLFPGSVSYWEQRYAKGATSGVGSYGVLAEFKAQFLNDFIARNMISTVMEFGCGDGNQLSLARYPSYVGLDVSPTAVDLCITRFRDDTTKSFFLYDSRRFVDHAGAFSAELTLSLDVVYHLIEEPIFEAYMRHLFASSTSSVVVYSTDQEIADMAGHVRHRHFTAWVRENEPAWRLDEHVVNPHREHFGSWADFFVFSRRSPVAPTQP